LKSWKPQSGRRRELKSQKQNISNKSWPEKKGLGGVGGVVGVTVIVRGGGERSEASRTPTLKKKRGKVVVLTHLCGE